MLYILALHSLIISSSRIQRFLKFIVKSCNVDCRPILVVLNSTSRVYQASLVDSAIKILLNCVGSTSLKMTLCALLLFVASLSSSIDHSTSYLTKIFLDASVLVGGVQPVSIDFQAFSSVA